MKIEYRFACKTLPALEVSNLTSGMFTIAINGLANTHQEIGVSYLERDDSLRPSFNVSFKQGVVSGSASYPRLNEVKTILRTFQSLLAKKLDLSIDFKSMKCLADDFQIHSQPSYNKPYQEPVDERFLQVAASTAAKVSDIEICLCFWRDAFRHYNSEAYYLAFYSYWFFLERMFGNGKTNHTPLLSELCKSDVLVSAVSKVQCLGKQRNIHELISVTKSEEFLNSTPRDVLSKMITLRGKFMHAQPRSQWHPDESDYYRFEATFLGAICDQCLEDIFSHIG